jgi:hypothetical protein
MIQEASSSCQWRRGASGIGGDSENVERKFAHKTNFKQYDYKSGANVMVLETILSLYIFKLF